MFECNRCRKPYYLQKLEVRGRDARLGLRCLNGHKGSRKITLDQMNSISEELFNGVYVCLECGSAMTLLKKKMSKSSVEFIFVCPTHGPQLRVLDYRYQSQVESAKEHVNSTESIMESMNCPRCAQPFAINEIGERHDILYLRSKCSNGHSRTLKLANTTDEETLKHVLQNVVKCDKCGMTGKLTELERKGKAAGVVMKCPAHGEKRKTIPLSLFALQRDAISELSRDKLVHSMLSCNECKSPLAIRSIEHEKKGYDLKCVCRNGHNSEMIMPFDWGKESIDSVVNALLKCRECDLLTHVVESKVGKKLVDIEIVCPVHETQKKGVAIDVYKHLEERAGDVDRSASLERSLKCEKCDTALRIRDLKRKDGYVEFGMDCRNGHRTTRYFANDLDPGTLVVIYSQAFECPRCHSSMELTKTESDKDDFVATINCATHGETEFKMPHEHELVMKDAYLSTLTLDKLELLSVERFQAKTDCEFTIDDESDPSEMIQLIASVIDEQNVRFVAEKKTTEGTNEVWYVGLTEESDEFLVIGSVSADNNMLSISVKAANEDQITGIFNDLRDRMRDLLLRRQRVSEDSSPIIIMCPHCKGALEEKALPGESIECPHCGVTLHW